MFAGEEGSGCKCGNESQSSSSNSSQGKQVGSGGGGKQSGSSGGSTIINSKNNSKNTGTSTSQRQPQLSSTSGSRTSSPFKGFGTTQPFTLPQNTAAATLFTLSRSPSPDPSQKQAKQSASGTPVPTSSAPQVKTIIPTHTSSSRRTQNTAAATANFGTLGKSNGGNPLQKKASNSSTRKSPPLTKNQSENFLVKISDEEAEDYEILKDNLNNWLNKQSTDTGENFLDSFKPEKLELLIKAILNNIGEAVVKKDSNVDSIKDSYNNLFEKMISKNIITFDSHGAIWDNYLESYNKKETEGTLFINTMQVFGSISCYLSPSHFDNQDKLKTQAEKSMETLIVSIKELANKQGLIQNASETPASITHTTTEHTYPPTPATSKPQKKDNPSFLFNFPDDKIEDYKKLREEVRKWVNNEKFDEKMRADFSFFASARIDYLIEAILDEIYVWRVVEKKDANKICSDYIKLFEKMVQDKVITQEKYDYILNLNLNNIQGYKWVQTLSLVKETMQLFSQINDYINVNQDNESKNKDRVESKEKLIKLVNYLKIFTPKD